MRRRLGVLSAGYGRFWRKPRFAEGYRHRFVEWIKKRQTDKGRSVLQGSVEGTHVQQLLVSCVYVGNQFFRIRMKQDFDF